MNFLVVIIWMMIGMNEWFVPQISEHWPENIPIRFELIKIWFSRPGKASTFTPIDGIVHEWITSWDVIRDRICVFLGRIMWFLVFRSRKIFEFSMNLSVSSSLNDLCSYLQYHWWPFTLIVMEGFLVSSIK